MGQTSAQPLPAGADDGLQYTPEQLRALISRGVRPDILLPPEMHRMEDDVFYGGDPAKPRTLTALLSSAHLRKASVKVNLHASAGAASESGSASEGAVDRGLSFTLDALQPVCITATWNLGPGPGRGFPSHTITVGPGVGQQVSLPLPPAEQLEAAIHAAPSSPSSAPAPSASASAAGAAAASHQLIIRLEPVAAAGNGAGAGAGSAYGQLQPPASAPAPSMERKEGAAGAGSGAPGAITPSPSLRVDAEISYLTLIHKAGAGGEVDARVSKQLIQAEGKVFDVAEIYGMEPRQTDSVALEVTSPGAATATATPSAAAGSTAGDSAFQDCSICMSAPRDTVVLPCRHLCVCAECATAVRQQTNRCPICRAVVEAMVPLPPPGIPSSSVPTVSI